MFVFMRTFSHVSFGRFWVGFLQRYLKTVFLLDVLIVLTCSILMHSTTLVSLLFHGQATNFLNTPRRPLVVKKKEMLH